MSRDRYVTLVTWLLRLIGISICLALFPIFFPLSWMSSIHACLGLGTIPDEPIFEYLTRSLSGMYFAHGCVALMASTDVVRYARFMWLIGFLNVFLGSVVFVTDLLAPMPGWWTALEGPPIVSMGLLMLWIARRIDTAESTPDEPLAE